MNLCVDYRTSNRYNVEIEEFNIKMPSAEKLPFVIDFLKSYGDTAKINIGLTNINITEEVISTLKALSAAGKNISFILNLEQKDFLYLLNEANLKYFFRYTVTDWDTLHALKKLQVSEMYIGEDFCFNLCNVKKVLQDSGIKLRTYANVVQIKDNFGVADTLKGFFIRPEDLDFYTETFDSIEFWGPVDRQEILYKIYKYDKKWSGDLREIIIGLKEELDSRFIIPFFAIQRYGCNRNCLKGSKCSICERTRGLVDVMKENGLAFKKDKNHGEV